MKILYQKIEEAAGRFVPIPTYLPDHSGTTNCGRRGKNVTMKKEDVRYFDNSVHIAASRGSDITGFKGW